MIAAAAIGYGMLAILCAGMDMTAGAIVCGAIWAYLVVTALLLDEVGPE